MNTIKRIIRISALLLLLSASSAIAIRPETTEGMPNVFEFMNEVSKWTSQWNYYGIGESEVKCFHYEGYDTLQFYSYFSIDLIADENNRVPFIIDYNPDTFEIIRVSSPFKSDDQDSALLILSTVLCSFYPECNISDAIKIMSSEVAYPESDVYLKFHNEDMVLKFMNVYENEYFIQIERGE